VSNAGNNSIHEFSILLVDVEGPLTYDDPMGEIRRDAKSIDVSTLVIHQRDGAAYSGTCSRTNKALYGVNRPRFR
jgi:hypothetical protein